MQHEPSESSEPDLYRVLTRYADSYEGFSQAAELTLQEDLAAAFHEIATRRGEAREKIAALIDPRGEEPVPESSLEGSVHRWWLQLRGKTDSDVMRAVLEECVRGEEVLAGTIEDALKSIPDLTAGQRGILSAALTEVRETIAAFDSALQ